MSTRLIFALHFHQPVGNFDHVFEAAIRSCYLPIVDHFERHPAVKAAFHLSGCLLEWIEARDRKFLDRVLRLVGTGQIEPLGGGFYEPILTVIPRDDALEQIALLSDYWDRRAGVRPKGIWLTERVWEQSLAELLCEAGVRYTILDDQHLRFAGLLESHFSGMYTTERAGKPIAFFPSDFTLRYLIPFRGVDVVRDHFARLSSTQGETAFTYGDDAEKFGLWPKTHAWVYGEKWLEKFFQLLEDPTGPVRSMAPGTYLENAPPSPKIYIPNASYTEMLEWALPAESVAPYSTLSRSAQSQNRSEVVKAFVRGSLWDMFLSRYPESDHMHKRVLRTSRLTRDLPTGPKSEARTLALRAQCNCGYWHGLFGGIYFPFLRHGIYNNAIAADKILAAHRGNRIEVTEEDFDGDFEKEIVVSGPEIQAFFKPSDGGTITELDYLPSSFNVTNVMSRWKESYHYGSDMIHSHESSGEIASPHEQSVGMDPEKVRNWVFDSFPLRSAREFHSRDMPTIDTFRGSPTISWNREKLSRVELDSSGWRGTTRIGTMEYEKAFRMEAPRILHFGLGGFRSANPAGWFGTAFALSLLTPKAEDRKAIYVSTQGLSECAPGDPMELGNGTKITLEDRAFHFGVSLESTFPARVVSFPIQTLQRSEDHYETVYQGTLVTLSWPVSALLDGAKPLELKVSFEAISG